MLKLFHPFFLILLNVGIIMAAELVGNGTYFADSGLIHLFAVALALMNILMIFRLRRFHGSVIANPTNGISLALLVFSIGHLLGAVPVFIGMTAGAKEITEFTELLGFAIGFILIEYGFHHILSLYRGQKIKSPIGLSVVTALSVTLVMFFVLRTKGADSFEDYQILFPIILVAFNLPLAIALFVQSSQIEKAMSIFTDFMRYSRYSLLLFALAVIMELLEVIEVSWIPEVQVLYIAHFVFYAGFTLQFLAFGTLFKLGGIYGDLGKEFQAEQRRVQKQFKPAASTIYADMRVGASER